MRNPGTGPRAWIFLSFCPHPFTPWISFHFYWAVKAAAETPKLHIREGLKKITSLQRSKTANYKLSGIRSSVVVPWERLRLHHTTELKLLSMCWRHFYFFKLLHWKTRSNFHPAENGGNLGDLWHLRHWLQFWQLKAWTRDNLCYLSIKNDTGQHSQCLQCLIWKVREETEPMESSDLMGH